MKKLIATVVLTMMPTLFFAQKAFEKFGKDAEVTSLVIGKKAFSMMAATKIGDNENTTHLMEAIAEVESVSVYATDFPSSATELKSAAKSHLKKGNFEPLIQVKEKGRQVTISVREDGKTDKVREVLIFVDGTADDKETVVVSIVGNFDLQKLAEMIQTKGDAKVHEGKISQIKENLEVKLQPNPVSDVFYLDTDQSAQITMYDLSGRVVKQEVYTPAGISVVGLKPETYIVEIRNGDKKQTQKLIVK
jgi:hypothetical protein